MEIYEVECDKCDGEGYQFVKFEDKQIAILCQTCEGAGILDWVQKITGVNPISKTFKRRRENIQRLRSMGIPIYYEYPTTQDKKMIQLRKKYKEKLRRAKELRKQREIEDGNGCIWKKSEV